MTLAEILFFCLFVALIYRLLRPLQQRLELWIFRRINRPGAPKPIIEINRSKKDT